MQLVYSVQFNNTVKPFDCPKNWRHHMQNYFCVFYFGKFKPHTCNTTYYIDWVLHGCRISLVNRLQSSGVYDDGVEWTRVSSAVCRNVHIFRFDSTVSLIWTSLSSKDHGNFVKTSGLSKIANWCGMPSSDAEIFVAKHGQTSHFTHIRQAWLRIWKAWWPWPMTLTLCTNI